MALNPNISLAVRGIELQDPLAQYGKFAAIQGAQQQNQLAQMQMQEAQAAMQERNALRQLDPNSPEYERQLFRLNPKLGMEQRKEQATIRKTTAEAAASEAELQNKRLNWTWQAIGSSPTPEKALANISKGLKDGVFSMQEASAAAAQLQDMSPQDYAKYRMDMLMRTVAGKDQLEMLAPKIDRIDTGGSFIATQGNRFQPGYGQAMPSVASIPKTATIGDRTAQGNLSLAQQKFAFEQANPGITVQQTEDGTLVGVNNRTGVAMPITLGGAAPMAPAAAPVSNQFSPRVAPSAAPAVTQAIPGMRSVLDQTAPAAPMATGVPAAPIAGTPLRGKGTALATSEGERKASTLLQRLQFSENQLTKALVDDPNAAKPGVFLSALDVLSTPLANTLTSEDRQRVESAQLDILDAALTLGTGAAYTKEQLEGYRRSYFPQIGDKPKQIEDKKARLQNVISAAKIAAGKGAALIPSVPDVSGSKNTVTDPTGMVHTFPTAEAAAAFKKAAGIE